MFLVVSTSLNPSSRSRILAQMSLAQLRGDGHDAQLLDLRESPLPWCDADTCYQHEGVRRAAGLIRRAQGVLLATPVYNYNVNAAAKNLVELTGRAWQDQVVGFLCAAGGKASYMSVMGLANSLMLDFRCFVLPRFVYAIGEAFREDDLHDPAVIERLGNLCTELVRVGSLLRPE
jgi:FMN reductase